MAISKPNLKIQIVKINELNPAPYNPRKWSQLIKDHGLKLAERDHFRNFASYTLKQGTLSEQDGFIRGLNTPLFVKNKTIYRRAIKNKK